MGKENKTIFFDLLAQISSVSMSTLRNQKLTKNMILLYLSLARILLSSRARFSSGIFVRTYVLYEGKDTPSRSTLYDQIDPARVVNFPSIYFFM